MTIQKTEIRFRGKIYEVILEDGLVSYLDPLEPGHVWPVTQNMEQKVTSIDGAIKMALRTIEKIPHPMMTFSD